MTKRDIVQNLAERLNLKQTQAKMAVNMTLEFICKAICEKGRIELRNFGVFEVRTRAGRQARNPRTNVPVYVPPRRVVAFQPGKMLAAEVARAQPMLS